MSDALQVAIAEAATAVQSAIQAACKAIEKSMVPNGYGHVHAPAARDAHITLNALVSTLGAIQKLDARFAGLGAPQQEETP